jgi:ABC-2 type transport system permease protein
MDLKKFLLVALKDIQLFFKDRPAMMIYLGAPLVMTVVIATAFGNINTGDSPITHIPVIVVNQDQGTGQASGKSVADFLVNPPVEQLKTLIAAREMTDADAARAEVRQGKAAAAVIIPADFSAATNPMNPDFGNSKIRLEVYRDAGQVTAAEIVTSIVRQYLNGIASADIAAVAAVRTSPLLALKAADIASTVAQKSFSDAPIRVTTAEGSRASQGSGIDLLGFFAPSMAVFFLNFAMAFGAVSVIEEQENGTLQRMLSSPTSRLTILAGKLGGTFMTGILQLAILIVATSLFGPLMGRTKPVWGDNIPALIVMVLVAVAGALGVGTIIAALSKDRQQASVIGTAILMLMGIAGGSFFVTSGGPPLGVISYLTINYWATNGFATLTSTGSLLMPNVAVLLALFVVFFGIGVVLFNRRLNV